MKWTCECGVKNSDKMRLCLCCGSPLKQQDSDLFESFVKPTVKAQRSLRDDLGCGFDNIYKETWGSGIELKIRPADDSRSIVVSAFWESQENPKIYKMKCHTLEQLGCFFKNLERAIGSSR